MKIEKGQPGYIKARKVRYLMLAIAEFAIVTAVYVLGYMQTGTKANLFTVVAVVGCLPAAKMLVEFITMAPHKSIDVDKYQEIETKADLVIRGYDMVITSSEKVMPLDAVVISGHVVCGYTSSPKTDETALARHIKNILQENHFEKMTVKIFHDYSAFLARAEGMNNIAAVEKTGTRKREKEIRKIILNISM
ncbi:MAG: hypothetical protein MR224_06100 [Dorea sp.]|nr:hypothetical protein [Dorea sp.]MDY2812733.1 hypothetical protein [Dorea sp.]